MCEQLARAMGKVLGVGIVKTMIKIITFRKMTSLECLKNQGGFDPDQDFQTNYVPVHLLVCPIVSDLTL